MLAKKKTIKNKKVVPKKKVKKSEPKKTDNVKPYTDYSNNRCIICGEAKPGLKVKDDYVIESMRWIKRNITKNEKNYDLVVCKEDYLKYSKLRKKFVKRQIFYVFIGVLFAIVMIAISRGSLGAIAFGIIIIILLYLMSLLSYTPSVEIPKEFIKKELKENKY